MNEAQFATEIKSAHRAAVADLFERLVIAGCALAVVGLAIAPLAVTLHRSLARLVLP